jgi:D-glycero-D-manno-heptose 1,7-bisphosphate phosphatase
MNKALFLDRDGVINKEKNYVYRIEDFDFIDGIFELCRCAHERNYRIIVITNQAGIARGYYRVRDYEILTAWMLEEFSREQIHLDRVYYCPYHPTAGIGIYRRDSYDRKPAPGMILRAKKDLDLDISGSILVGDKVSDIKAGLAAGIGNNVLLSPAPSGLTRDNVLEFSTLHCITSWLVNQYSETLQNDGT